MSAPITKTCVTTNYLLTREEMRKQIQGHGWNHYVYGLCHTSGIVFYIGKGRGFRALNSEQRIGSHQGSSPFQLEIAVSYYVGNMRREESILHFMFDSQHVRGEWFTLSDGDLDTIALRSRLV